MPVESGTVSSLEAGERLGDAVDEFFLAACGRAERGHGEAVDFAERSLGGLVESGDGVVGEEGALAAPST